MRLIIADAILNRRYSPAHVPRLATLVCCVTLASSLVAQESADDSPADHQDRPGRQRCHGQRADVRLVLPPDYDTSTRRYPVVYLLHGSGQRHVTWGRRTLLDGATNAIVVMPDMDRARYVIGDRVDAQAETFLTQELITKSTNGIGPSPRAKDDRSPDSPLAASGQCCWDCGMPTCTARSARSARRSMASVTRQRYWPPRRIRFCMSAAASPTRCCRPAGGLPRGSSRQGRPDLRGRTGRTHLGRVGLAVAIVPADGEGRLAGSTSSSARRTASRRTRR